MEEPSHAPPPSASTPSLDPPSRAGFFSDFFLHLHAPRVRPRTLTLRATWGLGVALVSLFAILTVSGMLLMVYYKPSVAEAYGSIKDLHNVVPAGRFCRNIHLWAAHLMVVFVFLHMARVFYAAAYKGTRRFNWLVGMALFLLTLGLSFTGYVLPWDQLGYWAATIGANVAASPDELARSLGLSESFYMGGFLKEFLLAAPAVGPEALIRTYFLHVVALPLLMGFLIVFHAWRIRKDGGLACPEAEGGDGDSSEEPAETLLARDKTISSWPSLFSAELLVFMTALLLSVVLAAFFNAPLGEAANPALPENPAKAPWYFLGLQELVSHSAFAGGLLVPVIALLGLASIPFLDRKREDEGVLLGGPGTKRVFAVSLAVGLAASAAAVAVPVRWGWPPEGFADLPPIAVILLSPGCLLTVLTALWSVTVTRREKSRRLGAVALFTCFLAGYVVLTYVGTFLRGPNWEFYWSQTAWPKY